ncbi:HBR117Wp [Eremothecium sinecaudum]|uniref:HBR117Wp n=1 Tax=Eremothecium sinecaudum TaxID=45286 RepID=A0A109UWU7_9SACH|nr:HBR117Wp [Eremothecium sinecaudum]AMD19018.1 HBR117Wp [Eremothecium sinecaudum]
MSEPSIKLRTAKDSLVSSLFELSKAANQTASCIVDFYHVIGEDEEEKIEAFTTLTEALQKLTSASNQLHGVSTELSNPLDDDKDTIPPSPAKPQAKKKQERDPNAPKKPLTVFFAYSAYVRQALREERQRAGLPPLSSTEITQEISKKWKELSDTEKDKWKQAYTSELANYQREKQKYLEAKKNGILPVFDGPSSAPVPIPHYLQSGIEEFDPPKEKRSYEEEVLSSSDKKKKKKKKDKKKDKVRSVGAET